MNRTVITVRWIARTLSVLMLLFWGYFIVAHLFGSAAQSSRPLIASDSVKFSMTVLWLVGLAVAWRWELVGAALTLAGVLIPALIYPKAAMEWRPLFPALLFLFCWWMSRASRTKPRY